MVSRWSVGESCAGLLPLALGAPRVSVVHAVDFPTFATLSAASLRRRVLVWRRLEYCCAYGCADGCAQKLTGGTVGEPVVIAVETHILVVNPRRV